MAGSRAGCMRYKSIREGADYRVTFFCQHLFFHVKILKSKGII